MEEFSRRHVGDGVEAVEVFDQLLVFFGFEGAAHRLIPGAEYGTGDYAVATLVIFAVEIIALTWLTGSSFGQRVMGIAVVSQAGGRLSLWRIVVRTVLICLVIPALVYDSQKRGLQDLAVGSRVVMRTSIGMSR